MQTHSRPEPLRRKSAVADRVNNFANDLKNIEQMKDKKQMADLVDRYLNDYKNKGNQLDIIGFSEAIQ